MVREEANLWRGAIYRQFLVKMAYSLLCAAKPRRSGKGLFLAVSPGFVAGCVARFVTDGVVRCFNNGFWFWLSWLCDQWIVQDSNILFSEQTSGSKKLWSFNNMFQWDRHWTAADSSVEMSWNFSLAERAFKCKMKRFSFYCSCKAKGL